MHGVWLLAHYGPKWYNVCDRFSRELFWVSELLLFGYTPQYLGSALGNVPAEHCPTSSSTSNIQAPVPKVGSIPVMNNQNGPHLHECCRKVIITDPPWKGYK